MADLGEVRRVVGVYFGSTPSVSNACRNSAQGYGFHFLGCADRLLEGGDEFADLTLKEYRAIFEEFVYPRGGR